MPPPNGPKGPKNRSERPGGDRPRSGKGFSKGGKGGVSGPRRPVSSDPSDTSKRFVPPSARPARDGAAGPRKPYGAAKAGGSDRPRGPRAEGTGRGGDAVARSGKGGESRPDRGRDGGKRFDRPRDGGPRGEQRGDGPRPGGKPGGYVKRDRPEGDRGGYAKRDRPEGGKPGGYAKRDRPEGGKPGGYAKRDRPEGGKPGGYPKRDRPEGGKPGGYAKRDRPEGGKPGGYAKRDRPEGGDRGPRRDYGKPGGPRPERTGTGPGPTAKDGPRKPRLDRDGRDRARQAREAEPVAPLKGSRLITARGAAVEMLDAVIGENRLLAELTGPGGPLDRLDPADKARAQRLASDTLRGMERIDRLLQQHMDKYPPLTFRNILRIATMELCAGEAAHGVVNEAVTLAGAAPRGTAMKGLVNAVLRKVAATGPAAWDGLRVPRMPVWLRDPLIEAWGDAEIQAMEAAHFAGAALDLTPRDPADAAALAADLGGTLLPTGTVRLTAPGQISELPGFAEGRWWVQDAAAAIPARVLNAQPGERVLDLCAAPGGKTMQLAAAGADVTALDVSARRMELVAENLERTGLTATLVTGDALEHGDGPYDAILLDAPCSATGTMRRHPDLPFAKDGSDFGTLIELQAELIDHALSLLKPGGRLVYCTCSLLPDEGECQTDEALVRFPALRVDSEALALPGIDPAWRTEEGGLRLRPDHWPDLGGMDGFYIVVFRA
ncbi:methyltransferase domain-containing protein [Pseudooceanicola sp. 216_PA32_1]|uniref:Methyltransferase domain-containing protein n=2 Tax=Pseudooceanicola pacificus TaxID=2676438 RepID=A0A844W289_9RHOB|nr:methyltransferase domain-containing protein [Pseudooceanicola pacificus]